MLDPDVVLRADAGAGPMAPSQLLRGAPAVASQALRYAGLARYAQPILVNGAPDSSSPRTRSHWPCSA